MRTAILLSVLTAACFSTSALAASAPPDASVAGKYDDQALRMLKESVAALELRKSTLKEIAPDYFVEPAKEPLTWKEALAYADEHFKDDADRRALFLWRYLHTGSPSERLADLHLRNTGMGSIGGSGQSRAFYLRAKVEKAPHEPFMKNDPAPFILLDTVVDFGATLGFFMTYGPDDPIVKTLTEQGYSPKMEPSILLSEGSLEIKKATVGGVEYSNLSFDADGVLCGFSRRQPAAGDTPEIDIGCNTSGSDGGNYIVVSITIPGSGYIEHLQYRGDLVLTKREIEDATSRHTLSRWQPKSLPPVAWPKDAPVEPVYFAYFPKADAGPVAARASAVYWLPWGEVMPAGWHRTPITDAPLPDFKPEVHQQVVQIWLQHRPGSAGVVAWSIIDGPRVDGWGIPYMWRKKQDFADPDKPAAGYTCETLSIHAEGHAPAQASLKVTYTLAADARTGIIKPDAALPAELPAAALVSRTAEMAGGGTVLELSLLHYGHATMNGRFFVWAIMKDGKESPMEIGDARDAPHNIKITACTAAIRLADVKEFRVSYCRYRTAVFENISLAPLP